MIEPPGPRSKEIIDRDCNVMSACLSRPYPLVIDRARGAVITDVEGKEYIDFIAGIAVMNVGHSNPAVSAAISTQLEKMAHCGFPDFFAEPPLKLGEKLQQMTGYDRVFLCNSGTESVEAAIKLAIWKTKRQNLVGFYNCFHGRTLGALSLTCSKIRQKEHFPGIRTAHAHYAYCYRCPLHLVYPDCGIECANEIETLIFKRELSPSDTAAIVVEPIQGEGGYIVPPPEFHQEIRRICDDHNVFMVADEVQAGCFRTGTFMAMENFGVRADIVCMAKALGSGLPLGAMLSGSEIMDWPPGTHSNTFGGNLLASASALAGLEFMENEDLGNKAKQVGTHIMERLREMQQDYPVIGDVRGLGLMIGVEIVKPDKSIDPETRDRIVLEGFKEGIILLSCGDSTLRFSPPLVITKEEADTGLDRFEIALKKALSQE
ncbi:MAG TPA: aminotransferase class III-fold pyridoxal phosphate-dependent enzyme [Candidatus Nanoarchaeia archaeon]|nr:aminotransferase class III-fold pyridoxal phosphate-dependent enzyme [Candidatus Nanoarchaeia archaeon]